MLEARVGDLRLRGIIDRLDRTPDGELVVIDYKTGRAPSPTYEQARLVGVHIYALLCQEVLGRRPAQVRLLHLQEPTVITAEPTEQAVRGQRTKTLAVWSAIERACRDEDFRPRRPRCAGYCRFQDFCPAFGGDPTTAAAALGGPPTGVRRDRCTGDGSSTRADDPGRPERPDGPGRRAPLGRWADPPMDDRVDALVRATAGATQGSTRSAKVVTGLGDHGLVWAATAACGGPATPGPSGRAAVRALAVAGVESTMVNAGMKAVVGRSARPESRPAARRHRRPGARAHDQQLPERAHPGRLLRGHRAEPSRATGPATPSCSPAPRWSASAGSTCGPTTPRTCSAAWPSAPPSA